MSDSPRSHIFARVQRASRPAEAEAIQRDLDALGTAPRADLPAPDLATAFLANVLKNSGTVDCVANRSGVVKALAEYLYRHFRSHRLVAGNDPNLAAMPWREAGVLPRFGTVEPGEPVALSYALLGVAEIGAIVTVTGKANPAANNLLSEHHIVVVDATRLVPDMESAWKRIGEETAKSGRPRGINFIAGPSSTGDIEGKLVYGAHGPRNWHVILMGDVPATALAEAHTLAGR
ncbi:MAG: LUD domain-containing protein [Gammaproteobacteria bacterium]|nr:LUD domain-containing protein [Gammaproteobacteria bacterium]MDH5170833.1 LUD domain-containing protein [Gammaproteobacteria bacterium]